MRLVAVALMLTLAGCASSPPTRFYMLDAVSSASNASSSLYAGAPIQVGHVDLPGMLDRASLVTHDTGERLVVSDQDRWAAPLDELIRRALTQDLRERLQPGLVLAPGDPTPPNVRTLTLNVQQFMADETGRVELDVDWTVQQRRESDTRHATIYATATDQKGEAVAAAMSRALAELADRITNSL